ncbi:MAG: C-GCAxxG-C-C family (seleno)protein [Candidatus Thorarchaeota archaeon]
MERNSGNSLNCAESVLVRVNQKSTLPGFNESCMRFASVMGGGFGGDGELCGAVGGGVLCLALLTGTTGDEPNDVFKQMRQSARGIISGFMNEFSEKWGTVQCKCLRAMDKGELPPAGQLRKGSPRNLCHEYVMWASERISRIRENL